MRRLVLTVLLVLPAFVDAAGQAPVAVVAESGGQLVLSRLPAILGEEEIEGQLTSGLTTTFVLRAEVPGKKLVGGARVDVRFELWDEVFQVVAVGIDGEGEGRELLDREALEAWWADLSLTVLEFEADTLVVGETMNLTLEVVPFSQSEQEDTQRWFSRSFAASQGRGGGRLTDTAERRGDSLEKVLGVLMATSIQRRPVSSFRWFIVITGGD